MIPFNSKQKIKYKYRYWHDLILFKMAQSSMFAFAYWLSTVWVH